MIRQQRQRKTNGGYAERHPEIQVTKGDISVNEENPSGPSDEIARTPRYSLSKKVCLLGDFAVGKTSLVRRFVYNRFDDSYMSTIGVKVSRKTLVLSDPSGEPVELAMLLWDLAGGERFVDLRSSYLRGSAGAILVCDLSRPQTLDVLEQYIQDLAAVSPDAVFVLAANKVDLLPDPALGKISPRLADFSRRHRVPYVVTSAKTGAGVATLFQMLGRRLLEPDDGERP